MDWSKAKSILIIAFIITNIFLILNIESNLFSDDQLPTPKDKNINDVIEILEKKNIKVDTEIPRIILALPVLDVEYETYNEEKMTKLFLGKKEGLVHGTEQIEISNNKMLLYKNTQKSAGNVEIDKERAEEFAEKFVKGHGFMGEDVAYWSTKYNGQSYEVVYKQMYEDYFLEESYMKIVISKSGVIRQFERVWLKPIGFGEHKYEIIPSTKALLKVIEKMEHQNKKVTITAIDLGYRFESPDWTNVKSGRAFPTWRIVLQDERTIFVDAYENR